MYAQQPNAYPGAYYGPPIPPPQSAAGPYRRRRSFLSTFLRVFIAFCIAFAILIFILWLIYRPTKMRIAVESATLSAFNLTGTASTLSYNLTTDISIRNPNKRVGIYYDYLEADVYYGGRTFASANMQPFYQGHKNTTVLRPRFAGTTPVALGSSTVEDYRRESGDNFFNIDMWVYASVRYKFGSSVTRRYRVRARCDLGLPLAGRTTRGGQGFTRTKCNVY